MTCQRPKQCYDLVEVIWDDAAGHESGWLKPDALTISPALVLSVGFLLVCDKQYVVLAQDVDEDGGHNGRTQIPRGMVKKLKVLKKKHAQSGKR